MIVRLRPVLVLIVVTGTVLCACTAGDTITQAQMRLRGIEDYQQTDLQSVSTLLDGYRKQGEDEVLYQLETAMLHHYRGKWQKSARHFEKAEQAIEANYTKSINRNLQSMLVNDLQLAYDGEAYEDIYLNVFNALNYLHRHDTEGALVEARRVTYKLERLSDRYKGLARSLAKRDTAQSALKEADEELDDIDLLTEDESPPEIRQNSALGRFLTTTLYGKTGAPDDARIELQQLRTALADQGRRDFLSAFSRAGGAGGGSSGDGLPVSWGRDERTDSDVLSTLFGPSDSLSVQRALDEPGKETFRGGVSVPSLDQLTRSDSFNTLLLSFTGRAPKKDERSFHIPLSIDGETVQLHFAVPVLKTPESRVDRVRARAVGDTLAVPMVEDMQAVAHEMFDQKKPIVYTRAVLRAIVKAGATEGAEKLAEKKLGGAAGFLTEQAGNVMSYRAAQADTRGWQTMPGHAHALVAKLPEGTHEVTFEFLSDQGQVLKRRTQEVTVRSARDFALAESVYLK